MSERATFENLCVELFAKDAVAEVFLNGFPVACAGALPAGAFSGYLPLADGRPIQQHLLSGENELRLVLRAGPGDDDGELSEDARARARIVRFQEGEALDSDAGGTVLVELSYQPPAPGGAPHRGPHASTRPFYPAFARGAAVWEAARPISLDDADLARVEALVHAFATALETGDEDRSCALLAPYMREMTRAYPERSPARVEQALRGYVRSFRGGGRARVAPRAQWRARLVAGGRLVEPRLADGTSALVAQPADAEPVDLPIYVGWVGGEPLLFR